MQASEDDPRGCFSSCIRKVDERLSGRVVFFLKSNPRVPSDRPLMAIEHKYNYRKVLAFIATDGDGSNNPGENYLSCYPEI